jgi:hypothetical protein
MLTDTSENLHYSTQPYHNIKSNTLQANQESPGSAMEALENDAAKI